MAEINFASYNLDEPSGRQAVLAGIFPDRGKVKMLHQKLLDIFRREMDFRRTDGRGADDSSDYFESIYHCALLLYLVGDPADVPLLWEGKHINMDTGSGFDAQFLVGAGVDRTIEYLGETGYAEIADYLKGLKIRGELDGLLEWERFRIKYYYPE